MITYFVRAGCQWVRVTTSRAVWAATPRAVVVGGCKLVAGALAAGTVGAGVLAAIAPPVWSSGIVSVSAGMTDVPEPSTFVVFSTAVALLAIWRRA